MRCRTVIALVAAVVVASIAFAGWWLSRGPAAPVAATPSKTVITRPGTYRFGDLGLVLRVEVDVEGLVQYALTDNNGRSLAHSTERASTYSTWVFMIDDSRRLWFYSGDVGFFAWDGAADGVSRPVNDPALQEVVPEPMKAFLR